MCSFWKSSVEHDAGFCKYECCYRLYVCTYESMSVCTHFVNFVDSSIRRRYMCINRAGYI